jgi:hypothetical protein
MVLISTHDLAERTTLRPAADAKARREVLPSADELSEVAPLGVRFDSSGGSI